ncbi:usherin-like [Leptopilina heterotoma]|uniref:usherin-like n=1 Tax=Leptopilina heterotoma TaxID=63436 RepID=UPI001CAA3102|nr:usherin-like [Leptopilina heterotoma]
MYPVHLIKTDSNINIIINNMTQSNRRTDYYINDTVGSKYYIEIKACNEAGCSDPLKIAEFVINYEKETPKSLQGRIRQKTATNHTCILLWDLPKTTASLIKYYMMVYDGKNFLKNESLIVPRDIQSGHDFTGLQPRTTYHIQVYRQNSQGLSEHPIIGTCTTTS